MVLLGDVVRVEDKGLLKGYYSFPMNAFITLWSQVGYQLSISEEEFIKNNTIAKELMKLVPFNDAAQFIAQYLMKPVQVLLRTFNPVLIDNGNPSTDTITIEPHADDDGSAEPVGDDCKTCEKSPEVNDKSAKLRSLKRGERAVVELLDCAGGSEDSRKKRKASGNPGDCCPHTDEIFLQSIVTFTKAFVGKKQCDKERILKQLEEEQQSRKSAEEKLKELEDRFKQQLQEEQELRKAKEEEVKALQDELQMSNKKREVLEDKLQGIKQFLQVDPDGKVH